MTRQFVCTVFFMISILIFNESLLAQEEPDYFPLVPQGAANLGDVQALREDELTLSTGVQAWQADGLTGAGIRVGILDQGFGGLERLIDQSDARIRLPEGASIEQYHNHPTRHGADVAEVVLMPAPRADLYLCAYENYNSFVNCVSWMIATDVQIINHSAGAPALPLDGTNAWAREVDRAEREGILWINAAGNFNQGFIRDTFTDTTLNTYHEFRGRGIVEALSIEASQNTGSSSLVMLSWQDTEDFLAKEIDLDLIIEDPTGTIIAESSNPQAGSSTDAPLEAVRVPRSTDINIRIRDANGRADLTQFVLFVEFASILDAEPGGSIIAPADSLNALSVGALQGNLVAPYSSRGPLTTGALKPDLAAPGEVVLSDDREFVGTSAAAPFVAGAAALIWQQNADWDHNQVRRFLINETQDDNDIPGPDNNYGNGSFYVASPQLLAERQFTREGSVENITEISSRLPAGLVASNASWTPQTQVVEGVEMVFVPPGCFMMGSLDGRPNELPPHPQCFDTPFLIDRHEVTNEQYGSAWEERWAQLERPRVVVDWFDAIEHCRRRDARLPTEAEWEYAAAGPDGLSYPWGPAFRDEGGVYGLNSRSQTAPVGSKPSGESWVGALDMSGNVYEWTSSLSLPYPYGSDHENIADVASDRIIRGGSWITDPIPLRTSFRVSVSPDFQYNTVGFRCAMSLDGYDPIPLPSNVMALSSAGIDQDYIEATFTAGINLRAGPSAGAPVLGSANTQMRLPVVGQIQVDGEIWYAVTDLDGFEKWAYGPFVQLDPPDAVPPTRR